MKTLVELVLRVADLFEAEGRAAKRHAMELLIVALVWCAATVLVVAALLGLGAAVFLALWEVMHPAGALAIVAILVLLVGLGCAIVGKAIRDRGKLRK